jgi:CheY-like chemotaxis protein
MSLEIQKQIFEPFFTTKEQGKGTGLGLATSFGIIEQHGGWIKVDSFPGKGTRFDIFLPRNEASAALGIPEVPEDLAEPKGGKETILVVDDELVVRSVAEAILRKHGYQVLSAEDGMEALDMLARHDGLIDLVLMDMTMPRLSGMDTFRHMRKGQAPNIPVVICSGYLVDLDGFAEATGSTPNGFLQKPYTVDDLTRTLRKVLDEVAAAKV